MNKDIKKAPREKMALGGLQLKAGLLPMLLGMAALGSSPAVLAVDECGVGPTVVCTSSKSGGVVYNFASDLDLLVELPSGNFNFGANGMALTGTGNANLRFTTRNIVGGAGGVRINLENGDLVADIAAGLGPTPNLSPAAGGVGLQITTGGAATLLLRGQPTPTSLIGARLSNLVMDVGRDSTVDVLHRRTVMQMVLSPRAGASLTVNNAGMLGAETSTSSPVAVSSTLIMQGAGAGHLIINNALPGGHINGRMDFTGMTGKLTLLNNFSGHPMQGGWHTMGSSVFGAGEVEIDNGLYGVLRTTGTATLDFSSTSHAEFSNKGRILVGARDNNSGAIAGHLAFIGLDRFENAGLFVMGADYVTKYHTGLTSTGRTGERLSFEDSHFVGVAGSRIALDARLGRIAQADCSTASVADCISFTGNSSTEGVTLLTVRDTDPARESAGFNAGILLIEGASAAEHFVLDPDSQFYVQQTSGGPALQKAMVAYRLQYDANTRQHAFVGTLADEAAQASTLGAAAHEAWRTSTDTWFDRQAAARTEAASGLRAQGAWVTLNTVRAERDLQRMVDVAGTPTAFNLSQDQDISHLAFGLDLLSGSSGSQSWVGGITAGLLYAAVDYEATGKQTTMAGLASGLYGGWAMGGLSVDAMFNLNFLRQSVDGTNFGLGQHNRLRTQVKSNGGRVEAAWKLPLSEGLWLQPLLGISHIRTSEGDITLPDGAGGVRFGNDDRSIRIGGGLRVGLDSQIAGLRAQYRLTGRMWNELEAKNTILVDVGNEPQPVTIADDFGGNFNELDGSLSLSNQSGALSGYVGVKGKFGDDYSSVGGSAGLRYQW